MMETVKEISNALKNKKISAEELAKDYLEKIKKHNDKINGFINYNPDLTHIEAKKADALLSNQKGTVLTGIPIAFKDIFCHEGWLSTNGSKILSNFISPYTATVVKKLLNTGMVTIGRTNMDEFAMGSTNETSYYGPVLNPWNLEHVSGGSSGGSAAAIAARLVPCALGSDTGGSIRQPASHCGITGIKPTYGKVSRFGMIAYASSFDQAGPMALTAEDCAYLLNEMTGFDPYDSTSLEMDTEDYTASLENSIKGLKIGIPKEYVTDEIDDDVLKALENTKNLLTKLGAEIIEVTLPNTDLSIPAYYILTCAEASTNLARYDGVRYGYRTENYKNLDEMYMNTRTEGFGTEVKRRILIGTYVLSHGYYDAYYIKAQKLRRMIVDDYKKAFSQCDLILAPVSPTPAPKLNNLFKDPVKMYLSDIFTISLNLAGLPGISFPTGFSQQGLPIGLQLIGNYFKEAQLLNCVHQFQKNSDWHFKKTSLFR